MAGKILFVLAASLLVFAKAGTFDEDWDSLYDDYQQVRSSRAYRSEKQQDFTKPPLPPPEYGVTSREGPSKTTYSDRHDAVFVTENSTVVTAQIGSTAMLPCIVRNLGSGMASWIRRRDYHLLTVGMGTYSNDERFYVVHNRPNQNWELHIKFVKPSDAGIYECQMSTHPPSSVFIQLRIVEAKAEILGQYDKHVRSGSNFELVCVLRNSTEPPVYVFWFHNDRMINYDNERGVVVSSDVEKSILSIQQAHKSDSGNYTCQPSNASPSWIVVHILNGESDDGEKPAAMQHGSHSGGEAAANPPVLLFSTLLTLLLTSWLSRRGGNQPTTCRQQYTKASPESSESDLRQPYYHIVRHKSRKSPGSSSSAAANAAYNYGKLSSAQDDVNTVVICSSSPPSSRPKLETSSDLLHSRKNIPREEEQEETKNSGEVGLVASDNEFLFKFTQSSPSSPPSSSTAFLSFPPSFSTCSRPNLNIKVTFSEQDTPTFLEPFSEQTQSFIPSKSNPSPLPTFYNSLPTSDSSSSTWNCRRKTHCIKNSSPNDCSSR